MVQSQSTRVGLCIIVVINTSLSATLSGILLHQVWNVGLCEKYPKQPNDHFFSVFSVALLLLWMRYIQTEFHIIGDWEKNPLIGWIPVLATFYRPFRFITQFVTNLGAGRRGKKDNYFWPIQWSHQAKLFRFLIFKLAC